MFVSLRISVFSPLLLSGVRYLAAGAPRPAAALASCLSSDGVTEVYDRMMEWFRFSATLLFQELFFPSGRPPFVPHKELNLLAP